MSTKTPDRNLALKNETTISQALASAILMKKTPSEMIEGGMRQKKGWKIMTTMGGQLKIK